jgi:hypothetical protein
MQDGNEIAMYEGQYKLRVSVGRAWIGPAQTFSVVWREMTYHHDYSQSDVESIQYADYVRTSDIDVFEATPNDTYSFVNFSENVTFNPGDTYAETSVHSVGVPSVGDAVTVVGPAEIGQFFPANLCGVIVRSLKAFAVKNGFMPYLQIAPDPSVPVPIYATEAATSAPGSSQTYSGSQLIPTPDQILLDNSAPGYYGTSFSPNVARHSSLLDFSLTDQVPTAVQAIDAQTVWSDGLILTLTDPIATSDLQAAVDTIVNGSDTGLVPENLNLFVGQTQGIFALRNLPSSELTYEAKRCQRAGWISAEDDNFSLNFFPPMQYIGSATTDVLTGEVTSETYLNTADLDLTITVAVDVTTTNLDTGETSTSTQTWDFVISTSVANPNAPSSFQSAWVNVPVPTDNEQITWGNPRITTATCDRWISTPQAVLVAA